MAVLIQRARGELMSENESSKYLNVHIRHGDHLGLTWKYHKTHLPTGLYVETAFEARQRLNPTSQGSPLFYIASDSPAVPEESLEQFPNNIRHSHWYGAMTKSLNRLPTLAPTCKMSSTRVG